MFRKNTKIIIKYKTKTTTIVAIICRRFSYLVRDFVGQLLPLDGVVVEELRNPLDAADEPDSGRHVAVLGADAGGCGPGGGSGGGGCGGSGSGACSLGSARGRRCLRRR